LKPISMSVRACLSACSLCLGVLLGILSASSCAGDVPAPVAGDPCEDILDCAPTAQLACSGGACSRIECQRSSACPVGAACVQGICGLPVCQEDADCGSGAGCFEGDCVEGLCEGREDCGAGQVCRGTPPLCSAPLEACEANEECPLGEACKLPLARCVAACDVGQSCPPGTWCDGELCRSECTDNGDCDLGEGCADGRCQPPRDCSGEETCPSSLPIRDPVTCECLECIEDLDCAIERGEACAASTCVFCDLRSDTETGCDVLGRKFFAGCCLECLTDSDCVAVRGESCQSGKCIDLLEQRCESDADCSQGLICDGDRCVEDASLMSCQLQSDCPEGEACYGDGRCRVQGTVCQDCLSPGRCVAEVGDTVGTCAGCTSHCQQSGCPQGQLCRVSDGAGEGYCVDESFWQGTCQ